MRALSVIYSCPWHGVPGPSHITAISSGITSHISRGTKLFVQLEFQRPRGGCALLNQYLFINLPKACQNRATWIARVHRCNNVQRRRCLHFDLPPNFFFPPREPKRIQQEGPDDTRWRMKLHATRGGKSRRRRIGGGFTDNLLQRLN